MGYELHITRSQDWVDSEKNPISLEEWKSFVESSSDFRHDGFAEATTPYGDTIRVENEGLSVWTEYSKHGEDGGMAWFDYHDGRIVVKNPDEEIIKKMFEVAQFFDAKVQGDEGEVYDENGESNWEELTAPTESKKKHWWKIW